MNEEDEEVVDEIEEIEEIEPEVIPVVEDKSPPLPKDPEPIEVEYFIKVGNKEVAANLQPPQSELQEAFRMTGARIVIDMVVAVDIAKEMIRTARKEAFAITDNEYMKALQKGENTKAIITKAEMLRNAPADTRITNAKNADELLTAVENIVKEFPNA